MHEILSFSITLQDFLLSGTSNFVVGADEDVLETYYFSISSLYKVSSSMIKVTSQMRHFVETRGCLFVAVTVLAVLWVSQEGERGRGVITLHWFTAQHPISTTQESSFALSLKSMVKWFRKYNNMNIKLHQTYPGLIGNDQNIPFYEKPRPAFSTMNYVVWYRASGHVLCSYCINWALQVYLFSFCTNVG